MTDLILGTAQFGSNYGITNGIGRIPDDSVRDILAVAHEAGIDLFDTAPDYGDAQMRLGALNDREFSPRYVSKFGLPRVGESAIDGGVLYSASLAALRVGSLYGLLFHRISDLRDPRASVAWDALIRAREAGVVARIGASIYDDSDLAIVTDRFPNLDLLQIPGNILDRRLLEHPEIERLHDRGVEIHLRSVYLQGLLLAEPENIPQSFERLRPVLERLREEASERRTSTMALALGYLKYHRVVDAVLVGATTPGELASTVRAWRAVTDEQRAITMPALPAEILDPRVWSPRKAEA